MSLLCNRTRLIVAVAAAILVGASAIVIADIGSHDSLSDMLGSTGFTFGHVDAGGHIAGQAARYELRVFGQEDTNQSPTGVMGTVSYRALNDNGANRIDRIVYEVRDPDSSSWVTVLDVSAPDNRIVNAASSTQYNTFDAEYAHADMERGIYFRVRVWNDQQSTGPENIRLQSGVEDG